jgi:hypothetical protein
MSNDVYVLKLTMLDLSQSTTFKAPPWPFGKISAGFDGSLDFDSFLAGSVNFFGSAGKGAVITAGGDTPPNTNFPQRLMSVFNYQTEVFQGSRPTGATFPNVGVISLDNSDGTYDAALAYFWDGALCELYRGVNGSTTWATMTKIFQGYVESIELGENLISLRVRDGSEKFAVPLQTSRYAGTGELEGPESLKGLLRPVAYGKPKNVEPVLIDPTHLVYQVSDRAIQGIDAVRDMGVALTAAGVDHADYKLLVAASITLGAFHTCKALGLFRVAAQPVGSITADVHASNHTLAGMVDDIVKARLGDGNNMAAADIDATAYAAFDAATAGEIAFYQIDDISVRDVLDAIFVSVAGFYTFTLDGKLKVAVFPAPGTPVDTFYDRNIASQRSIRYPQPYKEINMGYLRSWRVQSPAELADPPSVSENDRTLWGKPIRYAHCGNSDTALRHRFARSEAIDGFYNTEAAARLAAGNFMTLFGQIRTVTAIQLQGKDLFAYQAGQTLRHAPEAGGTVDYVIMRVGADVNRELLNLELWK